MNERNERRKVLLAKVIGQGARTIRNMLIGDTIGELIDSIGEPEELVNRSFKTAEQERKDIVAWLRSDTRSSHLAYMIEKGDHLKTRSTVAEELIQFSKAECVICGHSRSDHLMGVPGKCGGIFVGKKP